MMPSLFGKKKTEQLTEMSNTDEIILNDIDTETGEEIPDSAPIAETPVSAKQIKINKLRSDDDDDSDVSVNQFEEGFHDDEFGFTFQVKSISELDKERKETYGKTLQEMYDDLEDQRTQLLGSLGDNVGQDYIDRASEDIILIYERLRALLIFTAPTYRSILNQMTKRIEKIIASDDSYYKKTMQERVNIVKTEITGRLPGMVMKDFSEFVTSEQENSFGMYRKMYDNIKAQDFILTSNFFNVQYDNVNFFYVDIPEYLIDVNNLLVNHLCTIYTYSKGLKFGPKNAILDIEDQGFRFNFEHASIVSTGYPVIFARKNVFGVAKLIANPNYYKDLLSEFKDLTDSGKQEIIDKMRAAADKGNFLVIGRTGSGKTTLLRQLLLDRPQREQNLITIEDTKELNLPNAIAYLTNKDYGISDIFKSTLRMNPSRVIVGETRDRTILDILEVCLTSKSATTLHATDLAKAITRIRMMSKGEIATADLDFLITSAIDMFVFIDNRKITALYIKDKSKDTYTGSDIFSAYEKLL